MIPAGLNGTWVLTRASCRGCEAVTSRIEERVLRGQLLAARAALGVFTRNPDKRPESLALTIDGDMKSVPTSDHPVNLTLLEFEPPGFISGRLGRTGVPIRGVARYTDAERAVRLARRHAAPETDPSGAGTTVNVEWSDTYAHTEIENFMRLLVKIGYGAHVGLYGTGAMLPNLAQALILGQSAQGQRAPVTGDVAGVHPTLPAPVR